MLTVNDGTTGLAERAEELHDSPLHERVTATSPAPIVEALLHVDDEECGVRCDHCDVEPTWRFQCAKTAIPRIGPTDGKKVDVKTELELRHLRAFEIGSAHV